MSRNDPRSELRTVKQIAENFGLTVNAVREYIKKGKLRDGYHYVGARQTGNGRTLIHQGRFAEWLAPTLE